jgi:hypothetical protein
MTCNSWMSKKKENLSLLREIVETLSQRLGGKVESYYFLEDKGRYNGYSTMF